MKPGTPVRYWCMMRRAWIPGRVADPSETVFSGQTVGQLQEPHHVWAHWAGPNPWPTYVNTNTHFVEAATS